MEDVQEKLGAGAAPAAAPAGGLRHWPRWAWMANVACLFVLLFWILFDAGGERFGEQLASYGERPIYGYYSPPPPAGNAAAQSDFSVWWESLSSTNAWRLNSLLVLTAVMLLSTAGVALSLFVGPREYRTLRRWFALIALICVWIVVIQSWRDLCWVAKGVRLRYHVAALEPIVGNLRSNWPEGDTSRVEGLGAITAYPHRAPTILMLLTPPQLAGGDGPINAVEGAAEGPIRFSLAGSYHIDWIEWHPEGTAPASFQSGLGHGYRLAKWRSIGESWYLTRYELEPGVF